MSENDFVYMLSEYTNRLWVLQSWWVSVSLGMFTLAYFVGDKLRIASLLFILATFTVFLYFQVSQLRRIGANIIAAVGSLRDLESEGVQLSKLSEQLFLSYDGSWLVAVEFLYLPLLYLGGIAYLIHRYQQGRAIRQQVDG